MVRCSFVVGLLPPRLSAGLSRRFLTVPPSSARKSRSWSAGAAPTLRYGPAGDSATRLPLGVLTISTHGRVLFECIPVQLSQG